MRAAGVIMGRFEQRWLRALGGAWWLALGCTGCLSEGASRTADGGSGSSSTSTSTSSSASTSTTGAADDTQGTTSTASTGVIFVPPNDGGSAFECDVFAQDCAPGEKCTNWASDGGPWWHGTKCVPVVDDPAGPGEPCHVEGSPTSGLDDCDRRSMCFYVDPETLEGTCTPFCAGDEADPQCDRDRFCPLLADSALVLCLLLCSPLQQDCPAGQAC